MKFSQGIIDAYKTKWSFINTFTVKFFFPGKLKAVSKWVDDVDGRDINLHIISVDTPQYTNSPIEHFIANRWVIHNGRDELYRFSITFRDKDQMSLYKKFLKMYQATREDYFDEVCFAVVLFKDADWSGEYERALFNFEKTIIESVSQLQFNNTTESQIAEFTVNFKTIEPIVRL